MRERTNTSPTHATGPLTLRRQRRSVRVRVTARGHEVDVFEVSEPRTLRAALRPVYAHLPAGDGAVVFEGLQEQWLPFGLARTCREDELDGLADALHFLAA
ncbi:MAG: hypothetical protein ACYC3S_01185 [Chloroflexota bacterium]